MLKQFWQHLRTTFCQTLSGSVALYPGVPCLQHWWTLLAASSPPPQVTMGMG